MTKKIIIDTDPGIDDILAILLANSIKDIDILGISLVSGNVSYDEGLINLFRLSKFLNKKFNIYTATKIPLIREFVNAKDTHGEDGLGETYLPYDAYEYSDKGIDFILDTISKDKDVTILALGPLTNIATALKKNKDAFRDIRVISMGGAFKSFGNCSPVAEYNFWVDPDAADYVFKNLPTKLEVIPLDVTRKFVLTPSIISYLKRFNKDLGDFIEKITNFYTDFHWQYEKIIGSVINDPLTVLALTDDYLFTKKDYFCEVETTSKTLGMLIVDEMNFYKQNPNATIYTDIDSKNAMIKFIDYLFFESEFTEKIIGGMYEKDQ